MYSELLKLWLIMDPLIYYDVVLDRYYHWWVVTVHRTHHARHEPHIVHVVVKLVRNQTSVNHLAIEVALWSVKPSASVKVESLAVSSFLDFLHSLLLLYFMFRWAKSFINVSFQCFLWYTTFSLFFINIELIFIHLFYFLQLWAHQCLELVKLHFYAVSECLARQRLLFLDVDQFIKSLFYHTLTSLHIKLFCDSCPFLAFLEHKGQKSSVLLDTPLITVLDKKLLLNCRVQMIQPSFPTMFSLSEELAFRFDEKLSSYIVPLVFFARSCE